MDISQLLQPPFIYIIIGIVILAVISGSSSKKPKGKISGGFKAIPYINSKAEHNFHQQRELLAAKAASFQDNSLSR